MNKINSLYYLRAISAVLILLYHYTTRFGDSLYGMNLELKHEGLWWGSNAVYTFFILSGFLIVLSCKNKSAKEFALKRFFRLYPVYWVCIIITTIVTILFLPNRFIGIKDTCINFTMFQFWLGAKSVDGAYWTLQYELLFYAAIWLVLILKKIDVLDILSLLVLLFVFIEKTLILIYGDQGGFHIVDSVFNNIFLAEYAHVFISGISLSFLLKGIRLKLNCFNLLICCVIQFALNGLYRTIFFMLILLLILTLVFSNFKLKHDKALITLSEISYALYLLHQFVGNYSRYYLIEHYHIGYYVSFIIVTSFVVALAYSIHRLIEIPLNNKMKRYFSKYE